MGLRFYNQTWFFSPLLSPVQSLPFGRAQSLFPLLYSKKPAHFLWSTALPPVSVVLLGQDWLPSAAGAGPGGLQPINEAPQPQELVYKWAHDPVQVSETHRCWGVLGKSPTAFPRLAGRVVLTDTRLEGGSPRGTGNADSHPVGAERTTLE